MRTFLPMGSGLPSDILVIVLMSILVKESMEQVIARVEDEDCSREDRRLAVGLVSNDDYLDEACDGEDPTTTYLCRIADFFCQLNCFFNRYSSFTCTPENLCICHGIGGREDKTRGDYLCSYVPGVCRSFCSLSMYSGYNCTDNNECVCQAADGSNTRGDIFCSYRPGLCRMRCRWTNYLYHECNENNRCSCNNTMPYNYYGNETDNGNETDSGNNTSTTVSPEPESTTKADEAEGRGDILCKLPQLCKIRCKVWFKLDFTCRYNRVCKCRGKLDTAPRGDKKCRYWKLFCKIRCWIRGMSGRCTRKDECICYSSEEDEDGGGSGDGDNNKTSPARRDFWCRWPNACKARCIIRGQKYTCQTKQCLCHGKGSRPDIPDTAMAMAFASGGRISPAGDAVCGPYAELVKTCWFYCLTFRMSYIGMCDDDSRCMC